MFHHEIERENGDTQQSPINWNKKYFHGILPNFRGFVKSINYKLRETFYADPFIFKMKPKPIENCSTNEERKETFNVVSETSKEVERASFLQFPIAFVRTLTPSQKNSDGLMDEIQADQFEIYVEPTIKNNDGSSLRNNAMTDGVISDKPHLNIDESEDAPAFPIETENPIFTIPTFKEKAYFIVTLLLLSCSFDDAMSPKHFGEECSTMTLFAPGTILIVAFVHWVFSIITLYIPYLLNIYIVLLFNSVQFIDAVRIFQPTCWILKGILICRLILSVIQVFLAFPYKLLSIFLPRNTIIDS